MAHNELKPNYSSSEDDEEEEEASGSEDEQPSGSESEEFSDSASEEKPKHDPKKTLISPPNSAIKPQAPDICSSESEESGSETDSDSDLPPKRSTVVNPNIKPISSIPMEREAPNLEPKLIKKSGSKASSTPPPARSKRPALSPANEKDPKKLKSVTATDDDSKKQLFQRLWSEDDEIVILKGMIDYKTETGENLIADMGVFHEFIKKSLHVDVSRAQLVDKIRRLKKKYVNNASREKDGKDRSFSKSHEQKGYELSKLIWGSGNVSHSIGTESKKNQNQNQKNGNVKGNNAASTSNTGMVKSNGVDDKEASMVELVEKNMDINRFVQYSGRNDNPVLPEEIVKAGMELVEGSKRVELEDKWKSLKKQELEIYLKKMDLIKEQALVVLEAVNSSGN